MGWFDSVNNKSKYKPRRSSWDWWDEEEYVPDESSYGGGGYGGGYSGGYNWYKPKYDMSISLATRVRQLIRTITGKDLKLQEAVGWGSDEDYFYYNPEDLVNTSDDEVLGRILHQLSKELYLDKEAVGKHNEAEPDYRHLLNTLEDNRADAMLQERYAGVKYYAQEVWESVKFTDNPIYKYKKVYEGGPTLENIKDLSGDDNRSPVSDAEIMGNLKAYETWFIENNERNKASHNPSLEFCFNITALQNGEVDYDFELDKIKADFEKAAPYIKQYLAATTLEAALAIYPDIKKYYPVPTKQQQEQMDREMAGTQGLSKEQMEAHNKASKDREQYSAQYGGSGKVAGEGGDGEEEGNAFLRDFADDYRRGKMTITQRMDRYKEHLAKYKNVADVLYTLIKSILQDNTTNRFIRPFKRGKLDAKRIYKYIATDNLRIFKKKREITQKDYLMMIVVDMSGSMQGGNSVYATSGAIVLSNVIERLGFPYEIIAYNGSVYGVKMFKKALRPDILPALENANGDNNERETIEVVTNHIKQFDPDNRYKKSIFWITDGQSNDPSTVKSKITKLEKQHNAKVYALGIGDAEEKYLKATYNTYLNVPDVTDLPKELTDLMRAQFRRH